MSRENSSDNFSQDRAELFEALGHPTRIKILELLSNSQMGFSDLKKSLNIESSGQLQFHLGKLQGLIKTVEGNYSLTDEGKEALRIMATKETIKSQAKSPSSVSIFKILTIVLVVVLGLTLFFSYYNTQQQNSAYDKLNQSYSSLNNSYSSLNQSYNELRLLLSVSGLNNTLGLNFSMTMNTTIIHSGDAISVTLNEVNILDHFNNITASTNWAFTGFQSSDLCSPVLGLYNLPFTVGIVPGYYTVSNLSGVSSLPIFYGPYPFPLYCFYFAQPSEYDFLPLSNNAIVRIIGTINESTTSTLNFSGYYNSSIATTIGNWTEISPGPLINFSPGVYTVVGGDEWGQLVILHFEVT